MENNNYETPGNKVRFLCENILKYVATQEFKEVCENTMEIIFENLKKANFTKLGDQQEFWIDIHQMLLKDDLWNSFITQSVAVTKPEIVSLFFIFSNSRMRNTGDQRRQHEKRIRTDQSIYYVAGYVVFSLRNKYKMLKSSKN